jgi:5-deoxy-glucuronate isomerase
VTAYRGTHLALALPRLDAGERAAFAPPPGDEAVLVLLAGDVRWNERPAHRSDVFRAPASSVYLPPGCSVEVAARAPTELAFVTTSGAGLAAADGAPVFLPPDDVVVHERGQPGWLRQVHDVVGDGVPAQRLLVGETFNAPGQWSSFPPHKHDGADGEPALEEVYYFRFDRPEGFGFQGLYDADGDARAVFLRHGTVVGIPRGYHPVCAAPGYRCYYLWALAGASRRLATYEDPAHQWLRATNGGGATRHPRRS